MNRVFTFAAAFVVATPLFAAEPPKPIANPVQQAPQGDSPLVAAAKRSGRLGKKPAMVITNETLVRSGGHFTTTSDQKPITTPIYSPAPQSQQGAQVATSGAPVRVSKDKKAEDERQKIVKQLQMQYEGESLNADHDPAAQEHQMQVLQSTQPQTTPSKQP